MTAVRAAFVAFLYTVIFVVTLCFCLLDK